MINWFVISATNFVGFVDVITSTNKYSRYKNYYRNRKLVNQMKERTCDFDYVKYYHDKTEYHKKQFDSYDAIVDEYWKIDYYRRQKIIDPNFNMWLMFMKPEGCRILIENDEPVDLVEDRCYVKPVEKMKTADLK